MQVVFSFCMAKIISILVLEIINTIIENIMDFLCKDYNLNIAYLYT